MAKDVMGRFCEYVYANVETLTKVRFYFVFRSIYTTFASVEYMFAYGCLFQNLQHISNIDRQMYVNSYQTISRR